MISIVDEHVDDLKKYTFNGMKLGDTFKTKGLLKGVSDEPLEWRLVEVSKSFSTYTFDVTYYGILVGEMNVYPNENCRVQSK